MALLENKKRKFRPKAESPAQDTSLFPEEYRSELARTWRDEELKKTDWIASIPDHGLHASYMAYRVSLRDWPSTDAFPDTKPTL